MNLKSIKPQNYIRLFQLQGINYLLSYLWMHYYKNLDALITYDQGLYTSYLPSRIVQKTEREGLHLFSNRKLFAQYSRDFENWFLRYHKAHSVFLKNKFLTKRAWMRLASLIQEAFIYYSKTEFFFTDLAFKVLSDTRTSRPKQEVLRFALARLPRLKIRGRRALNAIGLETRSYLFQALSKLAAQFGYKTQDLWFASPRELTSLFESEKLNLEEIRARKNYYCFIAQRKRLLPLSKMQQYMFVHHFRGKHRPLRTLRGISASPGVAIAAATVIPPTYDKFALYLKVAARMQGGTILVAETTSPELMTACRKAKAIIANQGGLLSHAAVISRELGIPCIVGTNVATQVLKTGDIVEVDANKGVVRILKRG